MKYIIVDLVTKKALYGVKQKTLVFSSEAIAIEVAKQFFFNDENYIIIEIN